MTDCSMNNQPNNIIDISAVNNNVQNRLSSSVETQGNFNFFSQ